VGPLRSFQTNPGEENQLIPPKANRRDSSAGNPQENYAQPSPPLALHSDSDQL